MAATSLVAWPGNSFAQSSDEVLRRLEGKLDALAKENAALRDRVRRLESAKSSAAVSPHLEGAKTSATATVVPEASIMAQAQPADTRSGPAIGAVRSQPNWTGFYIGGNAGYGWGEPTTSTSNNNTASGNGVQVFIPLNPAQYIVKNTGALAGIQTGYNYQISHSVLGIEADFDWANITGGAQNTTVCAGYAGGAPNCTYAQNQKLNWFGTVRGRLGFVLVPETMIYGTGGFAFGRVSVSQSLSSTGFVGAFSAADTTSHTKGGWAIGAGVESMVGRRWMVRLEYLHFDLGTQSSVAAIVGPGGGLAQSSFRISGDVGRVGLSYKFD